MSDSISESEFELLLTPRAALTELEGMGFHEAVRAINERATHGLLGVAAETIRAGLGSRISQAALQWIAPDVWGAANAHSSHPFWSTAQIEFTIDAHTHSRNVIRLFGVRFDPKGLEQMKVAAGLVSATALTETGTREPAQPSVELKPPPRPEAERFARAILHSWPDCTQDWAYEKAVAFFPMNKVPRDWFRSILRSTRGPQKPGKKPNPAD